ncbi:MAG TPA: class II fructose-bisphosphate aldolase [Pyrinomonadaceae bacterium]|jgi:ketose-bisphosphate aldolase|nr:class II fructose-bisphosphate aldolase [Pyrinomonadaceae bacterium]
MSSLSPSRPILENAQRSGVAIAALNFYNAETILAHVAAAKTQKASIILQTTESTINYLGLRMILAMANAAAEEIERPVALHLDHGGSYELAARCIEHGYTSVMIDGSKLPFGENCELTRKVVELAHNANVSVEGELGHVRHNDEIGTADNGEFFTRPDDARKFVEETGVDSLAVAVGTAHGFYKGEVKLDFERLKQIKSVTGSTSLVLHGGSGVPDELLQKAIRCGISKINFGTELKNAFTRAVKKSLLETNDIDLRRTFAPAIAAVREVSLQKIRLCQELDGVR